MAEKADTETKPKLKKSNDSKFLSFGKYFLFVVVFCVQALLAYAIVDRNYAGIYRTFENIGGDNFAVYKMDELIVNPAGTNGQRYLVVEISMELEHSDHIELINQNIQRIKHNMNESLSSRTVNQLVRFEERELLRRELAVIVNREIGEHSVRNLYYTKYVMQ